MICPSCNTQNLATDVRCIQCRAVLIYEAESHSEVYRKGKDMIDARIYGGIGSFLGVCVAAFLQNTFLSLLFLDSRLVFATGMIVGGVVGAVVGWWNTRYR